MAYEAVQVLLYYGCCYCCYECLSICFSLGWLTDTGATVHFTTLFLFCIKVLSGKEQVNNW